MLVLTLTCQECAASFPFDPAHYVALGLKNAMPKRCPACNDTRQNRPSITTERTCEWETLAVLGKSAARELRRAQPYTSGHWKDAHVSGGMRLTITGKDFGASWSGRLDVWCLIPYAKIEPNTPVHFRQMRVTQRAWVQRWVKSTMARGIVTGQERCSEPPTDPEILANPPTAPKLSRDQWDQRGPRLYSDPYMIEESYSYVSILPGWTVEDGVETWPPSEEPPVVVYAQAYSKTTLKGFGRQFTSSIEGLDHALWDWTVQGGVRSGRLGTTAVLAVVPPDAPLEVVTHEGGAETRSVID